MYYFHQQHFHKLIKNKWSRQNVVIWLNINFILPNFFKSMSAGLGALFIDSIRAHTLLFFSEQLPVPRRAKWARSGWGSTCSQRAAQLVTSKGSSDGTNNSTICSPIPVLTPHRQPNSCSQMANTPTDIKKNASQVLISLQDDWKTTP